MYSIISFLKILVWTANESKMESLKATLKTGNIPLKTVKIITGNTSKLP